MLLLIEKDKKWHWSIWKIEMLVVYSLRLWAQLEFWEHILPMPNNIDSWSCRKSGKKSHMEENGGAMQY